MKKWVEWKFSKERSFELFCKKYNEKGQIYLPLSWSVAFDVWQQKIYEFLDDVAANAYVERNGRYVQESDAAVKKVIRRYHMGSKQERIYILTNQMILL